MRINASIAQRKNKRKNDSSIRMVKIKEKPINVSNTTLSYKARRHRKFDAKQAKRHNFGKAYCVICDEVFTKYHPRTITCSKECKRERITARQRKNYEENREKVKAYHRKYYEKNREKKLAKQNEYNEKNREKVNARNRKYYEENREKLKAYQREYQRKNYEENPEKIKAYHREYRRKKKQEEE